MSNDKSSSTSRRQFLQATGGLAAVTALSGFKFPTVHPEGNDLIQVALVGCGGRGSGAAVNAMKTTSGPIKLVAMADAFRDRLTSSHANLSEDFSKQMDVPIERQYLGFDAYKNAMDCLNPGDIVILTTPPAFRWVHFKYAISKKLHVFMEKPVTVDGPTSRRMLQLAQESVDSNLKVGVGLMSRHARPMQELHERIQQGELGEILLMRGYRMHGPAGTMQSPPKPGHISDLEYQIRRFHSFLWASGGCYSDFYIHHVDHLCWMKNAWPISCQALGGRHYRQGDNGITFVDQNLDTYSAEYTFDDGTKFIFDGRCVEGAEGIYSSYVHGTKGMAIVASNADCGEPSAIYKGQNAVETDLVWRSTDKSNPYQNEWDTLVSAIRTNTPHNEAKRGIEASVVTSLGRMAAHTGQLTTYEDMLNCDHEFAPGLESLARGSEAPLVAGQNGRYPVPMPGMNPKREY